MKKITLSLAAVFLAGVGCVVGIAFGQTAKDAPEAGGGQAPTPHKIGLIDINFLFNNYEKFKLNKEDLKHEAEEEERRMKGEVDKLQALSRELKDFEPSTPGFSKKEKEITELQVRLQSEQKLLQGQFLRKEAKIHQTVYKEVVDLVGKYCRAKKYTLILKYNREEPPGDDPREVQFLLQKQVVFNRPEDDITDAVLEHMNNTFAKNAGAPAKTTAKPKAPPK